MTESQPVRILSVSLIAAFCLAVPALAHSNDPLGAGPVSSPSNGVVNSMPSAASAQVVARGEAKNEAPFTAAFQGDPGLAFAYAKVAKLQAEAAVESRSTPRRPAAVGSDSPGFSWIDAAIGALVTLAACLVVLAAFALRRGVAFTSRDLRVDHA